MQLQTKKLLIGVCKNCSRKFPYLNRGRPKLHCCDECRLTWRKTSGSNRAARIRYRKTEQGASTRRAGRASYRRSRRKKIGPGLVDPLLVFARDRWKCQLCGCKVVRSVGDNQPNEATLDHIIPISAGGLHDWCNLQTACRDCNTRKGATSRGQIRLF